MISGKEMLVEAIHENVSLLPRWWSSTGSHCANNLPGQTSAQVLRTHHREMLQILETSHSKIGQKLRMLLHLLCWSIVSSTILLRRVLLLLEDQVPHSLLLPIVLQVLQVKMSV